MSSEPTGKSDSLQEDGDDLKDVAILSESRLSASALTDQEGERLTTRGIRQMTRCRARRRSPTFLMSAKMISVSES